MSEIESVEVITADAINQQALHSMQVMEQWGNGEVYNEATWIERGRQAVVKTLEGMFELGKTLIVLKEHTEHGRFREIAEQELGLHTKEITRLMNATKRFATPQMQKAQPKLIGLGKSKLLELLVEDDDTLVELAEGGDINGNTLDDIDRMTRNELRVALREAREDSKAKDKVMSEKNAKIDELAEKLAKNKNKQPKPADVARELSAQLASAEVSARSEISKLKDIFDGLMAHKEAHGSDHTALMVGAINQLILDCEILRGQYLLPTDAPTGEVPVWLTQDEPMGADDRDMPLPFDYSEDEV
ncbi:Uncharacterised protein [Moraxella lacunata]|uniref:Phage protein n=1 Tax=Moraxella lacunata TaxID=477 RepID=A0A378TT35_MORLA|nr:hypothetical protein [Moraxella lacunata]STZ63811.1 Uncharacterised protein [Moraxella lacunata]